MGLIFPNITLAILAGGKASRMGGTNKALLKWNGKTFVEKILLSLGDVFSNTIIIANETEPYNHLGVQVRPDIFLGKGPLGGIHSALTHSKTDLIFAVSCDMPFADLNIAKQIAFSAEEANGLAFIPRIGDMLEPLFGVYHRKGLSILTSILEKSNDIPIRFYLNTIATQYIDLPINQETKKCFTNINTLADYDKLNC
jgi:molybdopterin-guanine dinucleotide biosynthesis protein A